MTSWVMVRPAVVVVTAGLASGMPAVMRAGAGAGIAAALVCGSAGTTVLDSLTTRQPDRTNGARSASTDTGFMDVLPGSGGGWGGVERGVKLRRDHRRPDSAQTSSPGPSFDTVRGKSRVGLKHSAS